MAVRGLLLGGSRGWAGGASRVWGGPARVGGAAQRRPQSACRYSENGGNMPRSAKSSML